MSIESCIVDVETTGLWHGGADRIIEIALVAADAEGRALEEWQTLINPGRDLGDTGIHRINAALVKDAPTFAEIAGDILEFMQGRSLVAHNARFDCGFLCAEMGRIRISFENVESLCTMQLASNMGVGRSLSNCCAVLGIENLAPHTASGDAHATRELLAYLLAEHRRSGARRRSGTRGDAAFHFPRGVTVAGPPASGRSLIREQARDLARPESYMARLARRLPPSIVSSDADPEVATAYAELLDRVLEDRVVTDEELASLAVAASDLRLRHDQIEGINRSYLEGLVAIALADDVLTPSERSELETLADLLGIERAELQNLLDRKETSSAPLIPGDGSEFEGKTVCFTGTSTCIVNGERLTRDQAVEIATAAGLSVTQSVTKSLDILVVADADTQSGKAKKARSYGARIVAERSFWPRLGVGID